jgi:cell wall-associated NlpC family hydrolase
MRRGIWLLVLGGLAAALSSASARADGTATTTTSGTTTTSASSYAPLRPSYLPGGCLGAGAVAIAVPGRPVVAYGTPAAGLGPSAQPASGAIVAFGSSTASGSTCESANVTIASVSLFGGRVKATTVEATDGKGSVTGLIVDGSPVTLAAGQTYPVGSWGQVTLGATVGRVTAPLVLQLIQAHGSLPGGTTIAVAFAASPKPVSKPERKQHSSTSTQPATASTSGSSSQNAAPTGDTSTTKSHGDEKTRKAVPQRAPPDFPATSNPFKADGGLAKAAKDNAVVSIAMQYLGVPYQWGGASPTAGFDCSGLVEYVFAQLGVLLPHYAAAQWYSPDTVWVRPNRLQAGDLVFFIGSDGTRKDPGHVGIYVGDGYLIDAPHTGAFVRIDRLTDPKLADQYVGATRVVSTSLDARHLLHAAKPGVSAAATLRGFPSPLTAGPLAVSPGIAAAGTTEVRKTARGQWDGIIPAALFRLPVGNLLWGGGFFGGALLLLLAGALVVHRRRLDAARSTESSS